VTSFVSKGFPIQNQTEESFIIIIIIIYLFVCCRRKKGSVKLKDFPQNAWEDL